MSPCIPTAGAAARPCHRDSDGPPAISRLHEDVLWRIFSLDSHTDAEFTNRFTTNSEDLVTTARHASQVCSRWRSLILASSSLWANIIDLGFLDQKSNYWRNEVLSRTGDSLLSVKGDVSEGGHTAEFLLSLLDCHWMRLRRIAISVEGTSEDQRWLSIRRPAPNLELFHVYISQTPKFLTNDDYLFSNDAPNLHSLDISRIQFNSFGPWISHIRDLDLYECVLGPWFLKALSEMQLLERLELTDVDIGGTGKETNDYPTITLPRLNYLAISLTFKDVISLLGHIVPASVCTLSLESVGGTIPPLSDQDISLVRRSLSAHFQDFSVSIVDEHLVCRMTEDTFTVYNTFIQSRYHVPNPSYFSVYIEVEVGSPLHGIPVIVLGSLSGRYVGAIKTLEMAIFPAALESSDVDLVKFLQALVSVETIYTDSLTIEFLLEIQDKCTGTILLPRLHCLVFNDYGELKADAIMRFLLRRHAACMPITTFDLSGCSSDCQERLTFLNGIDWLDVIRNEEIRWDM